MPFEKVYSKKTINTSRLVIPEHVMPTQRCIPSLLTLSKATAKLDSFSWLTMITNVRSLSKLWLVYLVFFAAIVFECGAEDVQVQTARSVDTAVADKYLSIFGYYPQHSRDQAANPAPGGPGADTNIETHSDTERRHAIELLQEFFHLPVSGNLDEKTTTVMKTARCGWKDVDVSGEENQNTGTDGLQTGNRRVKRYALNKYGDGSYAGWRQLSELTWRITRPSRQIAESQQKDIIRTSLSMWAKHMPIKFVEDRTENTPDISIHFARGEHGPQADPIFDGSPTGTLNVLAHAWGPGYNPKGLAGDVHFDEDDNWKNRSTLLGVAVHELGHAMGLGHSDDKESIMYPVYRDVVELGRDDINGITEMYRGHTGAKPNTPRISGPDTRYLTYPPVPRYQTERPDPRYRTERPDQRYRTVQPVPRYRTERPDPRYRTVRPDPHYRTERPDPRYRTERPDPRYRTERPDPRYWSREPDINIVPLTKRPATTQSPVDLCAQVNMNAVFEDPTTNIGRAYIAVLDETVHTLTQHGLKSGLSLQLKHAYPEAPSNPDVIFSIANKQTVYFIKENTIWAYKENNLEKSYPRSLRNYRFPEHPKFSVTLYEKDGSPRILLFGSYYWWTFDVDRSASVSYQPISSFSGQMPSGIKFAAQWTDEKLYAVMKDSYVIMDLQYRNVTSKKPGKPQWMQALCGNAARASLSVASLAVLVILANVSKYVV
jgi:hypothetical protein